ncbi:MAG TPA: lysoplasmalogenase [Thermoflexia bacterium]|jgi:hypothetical protein|nr:lysoplasmalogenase [Thermoflexia bacterium]
MSLPWVVLACGWGVYGLGFVFGRYDEGRTHRSPTWARMVHSAALVLAALVWWRGRAVGTGLAGFAAMVFWGMFFSFVGDLLMARVVPLPRYPIPGMVAFGVAHVLYILGYVRAGTALGLGSGLAWGIGVGVGLLLAVVLWWALIRTPDADPILGYGALGYALLLGGMAGAATALAVQRPRFAILAVGALLFLISDAILGNRLFRHNDWFLVGDVVWVLYTAGQSLIVFTLPMVV